MGHATETICLNNMGLLYNIKIAQCDIGALCKMDKIYDMNTMSCRGVLW